MKIKISKNLNKLANLLQGDLYIVGGYVRNAILKLGDTDVDLAGSKTPDEVCALLRSSSTFGVKSDYASFGSLLIFADEEKFEYTTFRKDSYRINSGEHKPLEVCFTKELEKDAQRRDFTVNSIYYKIDEKKLIDPLEGLKALEQKRLVTCNGEQTFMEDGLRLMRLVRQMGEYGFQIDEKTSLFAKKNCERLKDIAPERKREELDKILMCDVKYGAVEVEKVFSAIMALQELGLMQYVIPELTLGVGFMQRKEYHKYDVFTHSALTAANAKPQNRLAGLLHDVGKPKTFLRDGNFHAHDEVGAQMIDEILGQSGLRYPSDVVKKVKRLVELHMTDGAVNMREYKYRKFIVKNADIVDDLIDLKFADGIACGVSSEPSASAVRLFQTKKYIKENNLPLSVGELDISGLDVISEIGKENAKYTAKILDELLILAVNERVKNKFCDLIENVQRAFSEVKNK